LWQCANVCDTLPLGAFALPFSPIPFEAGMESSTIQVQRCLDRLRAGESAAREELIRAACDRMQRLTRKMLRDYGGVRRWEETGDVFQNAMLRLCRALKDVSPPTPADFYRIVALQIRRELIDLARHHYGPEGGGAHHATHHESPNQSANLSPVHLAADASPPSQDLAGWTEFHQQVEKLPDEERQVFDLLWYQGLKQAEAAEMLGVAERTIKRRWQSARLMLHEALKGQMPEL
jgi:RNA polymerase sigma factor (sigma-70 family)